MPTSGLWNIDWLVQNSQRPFPLSGDASGRDQTGTFRIPDDFIVELDVPVHAGLDIDPARFFILHVGAYATGYSVVIGYQPADGDPVKVGTAMIHRPTHTPNTAYAVGGLGDFDDTFGKIVIGRLDAIDQEPAGFFTFDFEASRLEADAVRPIIRGVSSITVVNGSERSEKIYGDIELVAGENMQITPIIVGGQDPQIVFSAIKGEGLVEECVCEGDTDATPIYRINGIPPTPAGDFTLLGDDCIEWVPITNGLKAKDTCSAPCCGCTELEAVTRDLERFGTNAATLENFLNRLETSVTQMNMVVLGAKLNDSNCMQCE
jgi:hypothetical protein